MAGVLFNINSDDRKKITKTFVETVEPIECILKEDTSLFSPVMIVSKDRMGANWAKYNYAKIPEFGDRYYFIDNITAETGGRLAYHMTVDPLKTYAQTLLNTSFFIARSESVNSKYFLDTEKAIEVKKIMDFPKPHLGVIPQDSIGNKFCITVAGGV